MASGSITPLSLAYLIEISFVINLAYHELNTFKFRDSISDATNVILNPYKQMWENNETLVQPEWGQLQFLYKGSDSAAWEGKWIRPLYCKILYSGWDRRITRGLLGTDILILLVCTLFADVNVSPIFINPFVGEIFSAIPLWWAAFFILAASIVTPVLFMLLTRKCKQYVYGCVEEDNDDGKNKPGRLKELEQMVLRKVRDLVKINIK